MDLARDSNRLTAAMRPGDTILIPDVHPVQPDTARFSVYNTGVILRRNRASIIPQSGRGPYNPGDKINIEFPTDVWGDMSTAVLKFRISISGTDNPAGGGNDPNRYCVLQNGVASIFNLVNLYQGSQNPERIENYNLLNRIISEYELSPEHQRLLGPAIGFGMSPGERIIQSCDIGSTGFQGRSIEYTIPLQWLGLWRLHYVPFRKMNRLYMELHLDRAENVILCDGLTNGFISGTYQVQDINLVMDALEPKPWYDAVIDEMINAEGGSKLKFFFDTWRYNSTIMNGLKGDFKFTEKAESIKEMILVQRLPTQLNNPLRDSHATGPNNLRSYQFKLGSTIYPAEPIQVLGATLPLTGASNTFLASAEPFQHAMTTLRMWRWDLPNIGGSKIPTSVDFYRYYGVVAPVATQNTITINDAGISALCPIDATPAQFAVYVNFEKDRGFLSGVNTVANNTDISVLLEYNTSQTNLIIDVFWKYDQVIEVLPNGSIEIYK